MNSGNRAVDVVVIGGGPGGMSAAFWCSELGLTAVLVERETSLGGQLLKTFNPIDNYLGVAARDGREMASLFNSTIARSGFDRLAGTEIIELDVESRTVLAADGTRISWRALIIATGVRRRRLGVRGESEFRGRGVIESGAGERDRLKGKSVLIVGGGDAALENAVILSEVASSVKVVFRRSEPTARREFSDVAAARENVEYFPETIVEEITGDTNVTGVRLRNLSHGDVSTQPTDAVLIRIGVEPNSEIVRATLEVDDESYVKVNARGETSLKGIYAVGDVAHPEAPTISTATGTAAIAAKSIYDALESQKGYNTGHQKTREVVQDERDV